MRLGTITEGGTLRMRIKKSWISDTFTPDTFALSQRKKGTKWKKMLSSTTTPTAMMMLIKGKSTIVRKISIDDVANLSFSFRTGVYCALNIAVHFAADTIYI